MYISSSFIWAHCVWRVGFMLSIIALFQLIDSHPFLTWVICVRWWYLSTYHMEFSKICFLASMWVVKTSYHITLEENSRVYMGKKRALMTKNPFGWYFGWTQWILCPSGSRIDLSHDGTRNLLPKLFVSYEGCSLVSLCKECIQKSLCISMVSNWDFHIKWWLPNVWVKECEFICCMHKFLIV